MGLNNDIIEHPLPGNLQARVENALNLVTSLEAEQARLIKFNESQKSDINSNHARIKELEEKILNANKDLESLKSKVEVSEEKLNSLQHSIKEANEELESAVKQKKEILDFIDLQKKDAEIRLNILSKSEDELRNKSQELEAKEVKYKAKVERLLEAIK